MVLRVRRTSERYHHRRSAFGGCCETTVAHESTAIIPPTHRRDLVPAPRVKARMTQNKRYITTTTTIIYYYRGLSVIILCSYTRAMYVPTTTHAISHNFYILTELTYYYCHKTVLVLLYLDFSLFTLALSFYDICLFVFTILTPENHDIIPTRQLTASDRIFCCRLSFV